MKFFAILKDSLAAFTKAGGVVVVMSGGGGVNEMWKFVASANLLDVTGFAVTPLPAMLVDQDPTDAVGQGVANMFTAPFGTGSWVTATPSGIPVIGELGTNKPVVVHLAVLP